MVLLNWYIDIDEVCSENFLYKPNSAVSSSGKRYSFLYKDPRVGSYQDTIINKLCALVPKSHIPVPDIVYGLANEFRIGIPIDRYWKMDITNTIKSIEDAYVRFFKKNGFDYDDSQVLSNVEVKIPTSDFYYISCNTYFLDSPDEIEFLYRKKILNNFFL